jgi:hypothetical protein
MTPSGHSMARGNQPRRVATFHRLLLIVLVSALKDIVSNATG